MAEDFSRNTARLRTANCFTKSSSPAALAGVESRTIGWTVGRPLRSPFATGCHSCPGSSAEANGKFNPMLWRLWETNMQDQRWLAPVLFCLLIPHAQAQVGGSGS